MTQDPVYISALGLVSPLGFTPEAHLCALREGRSGIGPVRYLRTAHTEIPVGEVPASDAELRALAGVEALEGLKGMEGLAGVEGLAALGRNELLGLLAARACLSEAGLLDARGRLLSTPGLTTGLVGGSTVGGMRETEADILGHLTGERDIRLDRVLRHDCGTGTESLAALLGGFGFVSTLSTACSSGANALGLAQSLIRAGVCDRVLAGGMETLSAFHLNGFHSLMILDSERCRPFDARRKGINLGEAAAFLLVESAAALKARGGKPLALLAGYGNACDAYHQTATSPEATGPILAMEAALAAAGLPPEAIDYVHTHGTGTQNNDSSELKALQKVFGPQLPLFSSTKAFTGHATSAAGALEAALAVLCLQHQLVPGNLGFEVPLEPGAPEPVKETRPAVLQHILKNSFGFGGNTTALVFSRP